VPAPSLARQVRPVPARRPGSAAVASSLRFATAKVTRTQRSGGGFSGGGQGGQSAGSDPWASNAGGGQQPAGQQAAAPQGDPWANQPADEPPF
jgi:single-strand DNA-binding protein